MCNTSKMLVLFLILFIVQSNSGYRNEPFVFVKPSKQGLNSQSEKPDVHNRNKRQKLEQIRARHENKLTVNTEKYDLGVDMSKMLLDNKDAEIFHNKNINIKRSAKFKSKANKNAYDKFGYIYTNEEDDSMKENMDIIPKRKHENKHPFEKLILKKIKAYDVPLSKKKSYHKTGFSKEDRRLRSKASYTGKLRQINAEFIPNLPELQKYRPDLNKAEVDNNTTSPTVSSNDYAEDEPALQLENEIAETLFTETENSLYETECFTLNGDYTGHETSLAITNKSELSLSSNGSTVYVTNTTVYLMTPRKSNDEVSTKSSFDKNDSTIDHHKSESATESSKNISTFDSSKINSLIELTTQNVSITAGNVTVPDTPSTTCEICLTLFPSFGTVAGENDNDISTVTSTIDSNTTSSSVSNVTSSTTNGKTTSTLNNSTRTSDVTVTNTDTSTTSKSTATLNNNKIAASVSTTEDSNRTGKSQKLTKRNLSVFENNLFESVGSDITNGNNLMEDMMLTTCVEVSGDMLVLGTTESLQANTTTKGDLQLHIVAKEKNLLSETTDTTYVSSMTIGRHVSKSSEHSSETMGTTCMTVFWHTIPENIVKQPEKVGTTTTPQIESPIPVTLTEIVTNLTATSSPVHNISFTQPEKPTYNISFSSARMGEESEVSTLNASVFVHTLMTKTDMPILDQMSTLNLTINVSLLLSQTVVPSALPNVTPIINYTYPSTQTVQELAELPVSTLENITTEHIITEPVLSGTIQPQYKVTPIDKVAQLTSVPLPTVGDVHNVTQNETMTTKHGFAVKLPHIKLPLINKTEQTTELPICTEKFTIFPPKINTTISKLAVYTFHRAAMHSQSPCVYASAVTKMTKKPKVPESTIRLILSQPTSTHTPSELPKLSTVESPPPTSRSVPTKMQTLATTCMTVFRYTAPPRTSVHMVKAPVPAFQPAVSHSEPSAVIPSPTVQQLLAEISSNRTQATVSHITHSSKHTLHFSEHSQHTAEAQPTTVQHLIPLTTQFPDVVKFSVSPSEPTVKIIVPEFVPSEIPKLTVAVPLPTILVPESAPTERPKPLIAVPSPTVSQVAPETTSEGLQSAATTCMTVFKYTVPPPVDRITAKVPVPTDQQLVAQTTTCETVSPAVSNHQQLTPQTTVSTGDKPIQFPPTQFPGPAAVQRETCIPVQVVAGRAKGNKVYPIRHKGGDPGNNYYRKKQPVTRRFSKRPLLCTTIKFVECTTQYQPVMQRVLQNTEKVFIPKVIATKAEVQTCKPDSSDCSSCDFGNALPEMLPNKVELPPNPMPPVNLDFPTGNNDTNCVDLNQILNFTSAP